MPGPAGWGSYAASNQGIASHILGHTEQAVRTAFEASGLPQLTVSGIVGTAMQEGNNLLQASASITNMFRGATAAIDGMRASLNNLGYTRSQALNFMKDLGQVTGQTTQELSKATAATLQFQRATGASLESIAAVGSVTRSTGQSNAIVSNRVLGAIGGKKAFLTESNLAYASYVEQLQMSGIGSSANTEAALSMAGAINSANPNNAAYQGRFAFQFAAQFANPGGMSVGNIMSNPWKKGMSYADWMIKGENRTKEMTADKLAFYRGLDRTVAISLMTSGPNPEATSWTEANNILSGVTPTAVRKSVGQDMTPSQIASAAAVNVGTPANEVNKSHADDNLEVGWFQKWVSEHPIMSSAGMLVAGGLLGSSMDIAKNAVAYWAFGRGAKSGAGLLSGIGGKIGRLFGRGAAGAAAESAEMDEMLALMAAAQGAPGAAGGAAALGGAGLAGIATPLAIGLGALSIGGIADAIFNPNDFDPITRLLHGDSGGVKDWFKGRSVMKNVSINSNVNLKNQEAVVAALAAASGTGGWHANVISGFRTAAQQAYLRAHPEGNEVAVNSKHLTGDAMDIKTDNRAALNAFMKSQGYEWGGNIGTHRDVNHYQRIHNQVQADAAPDSTALSLANALFGATNAMNRLTDTLNHAPSLTGARTNPGTRK